MDNLKLEDACKFKHLKKLKPTTQKVMVEASGSLQNYLNKALADEFNTSLFGVCAGLLDNGFTAEQAVEVIHAMPAHRPPKDGEIERAVGRIYNADVDGEATESAWKQPDAVQDCDVLTNIKSLGVLPCPEEELGDRLGESPEEADNATDFLRHYFNGLSNPCIYLGRQKVGQIQELSTWLADNEIVEALAYDQVLANPMKRLLTEAERSSIPSGGRRPEFYNETLDVVTFESDTLPSELQLGVIVRLAEYLPLVSIVYSGGKSYHATFSLRGLTREQVDVVRQKLTDFGADRSVLTPQKLVRLGGVKRTTGDRKMQEVLWIDPDARMRAVEAGKLAELLGETEEADEDERTEALWQYMLDCAFDEQNKPPHKPGLLGLSDVDVLWRKNVHTLVAQSKAGKTHAMAAMIHTMLTGERTLGFTIGEPIAGKVAYLDFEQDDEDFHNVMTRAGATKDRVLAFPLAGLSSSDAQRAAKLVLERNDDIDAMFLDGYADLSADVNDQESAVALAAEWMALSKEHDVAILGVLHLNPGSDTKSRGHLGSQLERKSKVILQIDTDKDGVRETYTRFSRKREVLKGYGVRWRWCDFEDGFIELAESKAEQKVRERVETMRQKASEVAERSTIKVWAHGALVKDIMEVHGVKESQAKTYITQWTDNKIMRKEKDGYHYDPF